MPETSSDHHALATALRRELLRHRELWRTHRLGDDPMSAVIPQNHRYLRDAFGSTITDGACVIDHDREVGYVRLNLGPGCPGPDSAYWDGWFNVTRTRTGHPLRGKAMKGDLVQVLRGGHP